MTGQLPFLPYGRQTIDEEDIAAVAEALRSGWLTQGPRVEAFERGLTAVTGAAEAVSCANGTAALHLAMLALEIGPGDAVVVPSVTFLATANAARYVGAEVIFADVDPWTGLMGPDHLSAAVAEAAARGWRVRAVVPVHLAGQTADMAGIAAVAAHHGIAVVEDACHAIGTQVLRDGAWVPVGACDASLMACFSFHPVKTVAAGEGGALTTNNPALAERLRRLRCHGMVRDPAAFAMTDAAFAADGSPNPWYYEMPETGFNYRLTDIQAALGLNQLGRLEAFVERRRVLVEGYRTALTPLAPRIRPLALVDGCRPAWHLFVVLIDFAAIGMDRASVMARLRDQGIGSQVHYLPVYRQPYYKARYGARTLRGAEAYYDKALSLPLFPALTDADAGRVTAALAALAA